MKKILILLFLIALCNSFAGAQSISVTGRVTTSEDPEGMPGVSVLIKGATTGTVTDMDGRFKINVPSEQSVLRFSMVGHTPREITVGKRREINVTLQSMQELDEVVVVGYGEQKKASIVGAVANIKSEELRRTAPSNLTANIAGRITGALVRLGDGNVGGADYRYASGELDDAQIYIRGRATSNPASPLIIVDGVESHFNRINPEDVEQLSILKDASATAVYGVRGANGVIVITTKQGALGKPKININTQVRAHSPLKYPRPLDAYHYALLYNEAYMNDTGNPPFYSEEDLNHWKNGTDPVFHPDVDWYDELVKPYFIEEQYNANISGGTEKVKYYISGEYNHAGGPWKARSDMENDYKRYNLRTNIDFNITKTTDLSVKLNGRMESRGDVNYGESTGNRYYGSFWYHISATPPNIAPIRWPNGSWAYGTDGTWNVRAILEDGGYRTRMSNSLDAGFTLKQKLDFILSGLSANALYSSTYTGGYRRVWGTYEQIPAKWDYSINPVTGEEIYTMRAPEFPRERGTAVDHENLVPFNRRFQTEFKLLYDKILFKKHKVNALALFQQSKQENNADLPVSTRGFSGRLNYSYDSKYIADLSAAYNGSDRFAKENRYALFPAGALGWVISEENFWKDHIAFIPYLKLRGGYGTVGNDRIASGMRYMYRYSFNDSPRRYTESTWETYNFGETPQTQRGINEGALGNEKVKWEVARKGNIGFDLHAWESKIKFTADVFREKRDNILANREDIPSQTGLSGTLPPVNVRKVSNRGYEFELSYADKYGNFDFSVSGNYSFARSNVEDWAEAQQEYEYRMMRGHPIGQPIGYIWTGEFYSYADMVNPDVAKPLGNVQAGDLKFKDLNGDGVIDANDMTRELGKNGIGYGSIPEIVYGFNTHFGFKRFYLDVFWQGAAHVSSRWERELRYEFYGLKGGNVFDFHLDRWTPETAETAKYPRLGIQGAPLTREASTFQYINSDFLRLKSVELGYNFPKKSISNVGLSDLRIFVGGSNLLTFDKVGFIDPEYNPDGSGNRGNSYPQTKFFSLGVNIGF